MLDITSIMNKIILVLFIAVFSLSAFAQRKLNPSSEEVAQAKKLKENHKDEDIVTLSKSVTISFQKGKKSGHVAAKREEYIDLINISSASRMQYPVFYDGESEIEKFIVKSRENKVLRDGAFHVRDEHLKSDELFHTDYRVQYVNLSFPLQGSKYKIDTEKKYHDVKYFTSEYLSGQYRILEGMIYVIVPHWLDLEIKEFNFEGHSITKEVKTNDREQIIIYSYSSMEPQSMESFTPGPSYLYPHLLFIAKSYTDGTVQQVLFNETKNLYEWYNGLAENVEVDPSVFSEKVMEITENAADDEEKIKNIFYWVQDNIRYIAFEDGIAGFQPDSPQNVYNKRYGDCKGMAILTKSMLEVAGFNSRLVWLGTDRLAYDYSIPSLSVDNHMICSVELNGETIFLDATEKYNRFGEYASRIQNKQALLQSESGFKILTIPQASENANIDNVKYELKIEDGVILGSANRFYSAECRVDFQNNYSSFGKGSQLEVLTDYLTSGNSNYKVKNIHPFDEHERDKDLNISYEVAIEKAISEFDGTLYLDIDPVKVAAGYLFEKRKQDYKASIKHRKITDISLEIPEGYTIEMLPENLLLSNDLVDINVIYQHQGNKIVYKKDIHFKKRLIKKAQFDIWNKAFTELRENLSQQITLVKN